MSFSTQWPMKSPTHAAWAVAGPPTRSRRSTAFTALAAAS
jgi:hypothetical protein